jgi:two-component system cell cycle sensor histidine kinase/response regulator CckA
MSADRNDLPHARSEGRRAADATGEEARRLLDAVEDLNGIADTDTLLDRLAEHSARIAGYRASLLSLALPEGAMVGTFNLPAEDRALFKRRARNTAIDYRIEKRRRIRRYAFPGTSICFVPHDADLDRAPLSEVYMHLPREEGTWNPGDRLFILVKGAAGREIGTFSLDIPEDGNAPREDSLGRLRLAERLLFLGGNLLQTRLLEQTLRRGEEEMRTLVEDAPVGIYRRTEGEGLVSVNRRLASIFGYESPEEMMADGSARRRLEPPEVARALDALRGGDEAEARDVDTTRRDGRPLRLRLKARRLPAHGVLLGIVSDVTEASLLAEHLHRARRLEAVGTLASGIAHDFNNILCSILGYASLLREKSAPGSPAEVAARAIEEASERGSDLTQRLLGIAREAPRETTVVDVSAVVADCGRIARETFDRRIEVGIDAPSGLPGVRGRTSDLHQAVLNLCINARDAMPGGGRLRLSVARSPTGPSRPPDGSHKGAWVRVEVADEGEGMDPATQARIFEPFFTTKLRGKGTGLGLYMVYATVRAHGGAVDVESETGRGTVFRLFLPAALEAAEVPPAAPPPPPPPAPASARILVVEDEEMLRNLATAVLSAQGYTVESAGDGESAVALIEAPGSAFDLVLLDLVLPKMTGIDVFHRLRAARPRLPVILSSGNVDEGMLDQELRTGVAALLPKPYRAGELVSAVARVLAEAAGRA